MGVFIIKEPKIYADGIDVTGKANSFSINLECDMVEKTNFDSSGAKEYTAGLVNWTAEYSGFFSAGENEPDETEFNTLGNACEAYILIAPESGTTGELAYFGKSVNTAYSIGGSVGEINSFSMSMQGNDKIGNGTIIFTRTINAGSSAYGEVYDLGALASGQQIKTILQLYSFSGAGNFKTVLDASCTSGFGSGVTEVSFTTLTDEGADLQASTLGGSTDKPFFRVDYASSGVGIGVTKAILAVAINN